MQITIERIEELCDCRFTRKGYSGVPVSEYVVCKKDFGTLDERNQPEQIVVIVKQGRVDCITIDGNCRYVTMYNNITEMQFIQALTLVFPDSFGGSTTYRLPQSEN